MIQAAAVPTTFENDCINNYFDILLFLFRNQDRFKVKRKRSLFIMGANNSKARVIDENNEYRNAVIMNYEHYSLSTSSEKRSEDESGTQQLADVVSTGENTFSLIADVLETYGEETNETLMKCLLIIKGGKYFCEVAGIVLNLLVDDQVAAQLNKIYEEIRGVRNDIRELEQSMKWETTRIQYADICTMIVTGMGFCIQIQSNAGNDSLKHDYEERLKELCSNQRFTLAMNTLLDGITGKGDFRVDILQLIYEQTSGSRPGVMRMAGRLVQLLSGGMTTLLTYETLMRGRQSAEELAVAMYADRLQEAEQCYKNVIQRCVDESKENMATDVDIICEGEHQLEDVPKVICEKLAGKYDWLQFQCMVHKNGVVLCHGSRIEKCRYDADIICFYTSKSSPLNTFSSSQKGQINEIISKRHRSGLSAVRVFLVKTEGDKPDGYDTAIEYLNQISDQRQCWVVGASTSCDTRGQGIYGDYPQPLKVYHEVSEGSYQHLITKCKLSSKYCFVSMFFQD